LRFPTAFLLNKYIIEVRAVGGGYKRAKPLGGGYIGGAIWNKVLIGYWDGIREGDGNEHASRNEGWGLSDTTQWIPKRAPLAVDTILLARRYMSR
jgi:hypothetical protein